MSGITRRCVPRVPLLFCPWEGCCIVGEPRAAPPTPRWELESVIRRSPSVGACSKPDIPVCDWETGPCFLRAASNRWSAWEMGIVVLEKAE